MRFGYDDARAAATGSIAQLLPVFLMPILGLCVDRFGKRTWMSEYHYLLCTHTPTSLFTLHDNSHRKRSHIPCIITTSQLYPHCSCGGHAVFQY